MDIGDGASLELLDQFCYLGDMLSVDGDADAAFEARVHKRSDKFRQLVPLLTNKDVSLLMSGKLHRSCGHSCTLHGGETWPVKTLQRTEMRMIRSMCGVERETRNR